MTVSKSLTGSVERADDADRRSRHQRNAELTVAYDVEFGEYCGIGIEVNVE